MISDTVCMSHSYAFRNTPAREKVTNSVIAIGDRSSHKSLMLDHEALRDELIRQLDAGEIKAVEVAKELGIAKPRIVELRKRQRRVQQHEMEPLARLLGLIINPAEIVMMSVALPNVATLTRLFEGLFEAVDRPDLADELALRLAQHFPGALRRTLERPANAVVAEPQVAAAKPERSSIDRRVRQ